MQTHLVLSYPMPLPQCNTSKLLLEEAAEIQDPGQKHKLSTSFLVNNKCFTKSYFEELGELG